MEKEVTIDIIEKKMLCKDYSQIEKIEFAYPEFMAIDAEQKAIKLFNEIKSERDKIINLRQEANKIEEALKEKEALWNKLSQSMTVTYKTFEQEEIKGESNIVFNMSAEINKHLH